MEPLITFGLPLLAGGIYVVGVLGRHRQLLDQWQALAAKHQLAVLETSSVWAARTSVTARAGVMEVRFEKIPKRGLWLHLTIPGLVATSGLRLRREPFVALGGREIETGDESFDRTFLVEGSAAMVMALLDSKTRRLLLQVNVEGELEVRGGVVSVRVTDTTLPQLLPVLLELGQRLTTGSDIVRRMAEIARQDREPGVRLRTLLLLEREFPGEQLTRDTLRAACSDAGPQIRLRAAIGRGAEGLKTLIALAEDQEVDDTWSAQAVSTLGRQLPWERTQQILRQSLRRRRPETALACLAALGQWRGAALAELVRVLEREPDELATAAALALGETGEAEAEAPLLRALQHGSAEVRTAAVGALGRVGTAASVLPLKEVAEEDRALRPVARQAVAEIQSRLQGASPGQLSLAQAEAGQLSLATDPAGQLSLLPDGPVG